MKKLLTAAILFSAVLPLALSALHPGQDAAAITKVRWVNGIPLDTLPLQDPAAPEFRAVVFVLCRAVVADDTIRMLTKLQRDHSGRLRIAVVTPDPESDAKALAARHNSPPVAIGVDTSRKITPFYMEGSLLYPQAFLIDRKGLIIWRGEAIDLGEALGNAVKGNNDPDDEARISRLLEELQTLMRDNRDQHQDRVVQQIFRLDPDNPAALRMRLFTLENTGRFREASQLVAERIAACPASARLYFTALDLFQRHGAEKSHIISLLNSFRKNITVSDTRIAMALLLLERFPMDSSMLNTAVSIIRESRNDSPASSIAMALVYYRTGQLAKAVAAQEAAVKGLRSSGDPELIRDAESRAEYYRSAMKAAADLP